MNNDNRKVDDCQTLPYFSVYVLYCVTTEKYYVGITSQPVIKRINQHKYGKQFIDKEIQRTGWENWDWWIVEKHVPSNLISDCERSWIDSLNSLYPNGYNKTCGGIARIVISEDTRKKMNTSKRGKPSNRKGKHHTESAKLKMRKAKIGTHNSPETRMKISESNKGKHQSPETRAKMSESHKREKLSRT